MKQPSLQLAQGYVSALRKHLLADGRASLKSALRLGRQTVAIGLTTLDLARIHEQAVVTLLSLGGLPGTKARNIRRAAIFFVEANSPIAEAGRTTGRTEVDFIQLRSALEMRTEELTAAKYQLQQGVVRDRVREDAYEKHRELHKKSLGDSLRLEKRLRQLTHRLLAAQENERQNIGRELQNEIVQTLLGINVHLLALKQEARGKTKRFENEIASAQRLLLKSASVVRRAARKFVTHEPKAPDLVAPLSGRVANPPQPGRSGKPGIRARTGR